jgi:hypothetical protein
MSKQEQTRDIMKQLGPITEINIKVKLPRAFLDYINEIEKADLGEYCSEEVIAAMIAHLDGPKNIVQNILSILVT